VEHQQLNLTSTAAEKKKDGAVITMNGVGLGKNGKDQAKGNPMKYGQKALDNTVNGMARLSPPPAEVCICVP
jgi:chemotaxis receptor (MCP) glutamine deamidase CheD